MKNNVLLVFIVILILSGPAMTSEAGKVSNECGEADQLFATGNYEKAILSYQSLLSLPTRVVSSSVLHTRIADSYFRLNDYKRALDAYRLALKDQKQPECAQTQYWIGFCDFLLGRNAEAVNEFLKIPMNYPASGMWVVTAYYWAGRASERMGGKEQASVFYRKAAGSGKSSQERFAMKKANAVKKGDRVQGSGSR